MERMERRVEGKRCWALFFLALIASVLIPMGAQAATRNLSLNNAWVSGTIANDGDVDFYRIQTTKDGFITIDYQGWSIRDSYVEVMDGDLTTSYEKHNVYYSSDTAPLTETMELPLEAGIYYVRIWGYGSNVGNYRVRGSFRPANNTESEPNGNFSLAMPLPAGRKVTGFLGLTDRLDFYCFTIPSRKKIAITYTGMIKDSYISLWDKDYQQIMRKNVYYASESEPLTYVYEENLDAGTYYIKIEPYSSSHSGRYQLIWKQATVPVSSISLSGNKRVAAGKSFNLRASVSPSNATNKSLTWSSSNTSVATVTSSGKVQTKKTGSATIRVKAKDGSGVSASCKVIVLPGTCPTPRVTQLGGGKVKVTWNKRTGVSGYAVQFSKKSSFSGAKTNYFGKGVTAIQVSNMAKTTYFFRMRAYITVNGKKYFGNWSGTRRVVMRSGASNSAGKTVYRAVVIGEANYYPYANSLIACKYDANAMAAMLKKTGYKKVTKKIDASKSAIKSAITKGFSGADSNDVSLFYYSGHGSSDGSLYSVKGESISTATLTNWLKKIKGNVIVILDSCYSGTIIGKSADGTISMKEAQNFNRNVINAFAMADSTVKSGEMCTNKFKVLTACHYYQTSGCYNSTNPPYSIFTEKLVSGVGFSYSGARRSSAPADTNNNKKLTLQECWHYTYYGIYGQDAQCYPTNSSFKLFQR